MAGHWENISKRLLMGFRDRFSSSFFSKGVYLNLQLFLAATELVPKEEMGWGRRQLDLFLFVHDDEGSFRGSSTLFLFFMKTSREEKKGLDGFVCVARAKDNVHFTARTLFVLHLPATSVVRFAAPSSSSLIPLLANNQPTFHSPSISTEKRSKCILWRNWPSYRKVVGKERVGLRLLAIYF